MTVRSKKALKLAKGQNCTLRLVGICNFNPETTVAAHIGRNRGMGHKCGDNMVVYACSACHAAIDSAGRDQYADDKLRALEETQQILFDNDVMEMA